MYKRKRLGPFITVAIRNSEVGRYSGGGNVQYEWQKKSVPEVASAIWSESAIGEVGYRRFHCTLIGSCLVQNDLLGHVIGHISLCIRHMCLHVVVHTFYMK